MTADSWIIYDEFKERMGDGTIDMDGDTFKLALFLSTSNCGNRAVGTTILADLTNQHANANGYTTGGVTLSSVTWVESSGTITFDCADPTWTASGGNLVFRFGVIWDDTPAAPADPLVGYTIFDNTPADVTVLDGNVFTMNVHTNGLFTLAGGET